MSDPIFHRFRGLLFGHMISDQQRRASGADNNVISFELACRTDPEIKKVLAEEGNFNSMVTEDGLYIPLALLPEKVSSDESMARVLDFIAGCFPTIIGEGKKSICIDADQQACASICRVVSDPQYKGKYDWCVGYGGYWHCLLHFGILDHHMWGRTILFAVYRFLSQNVEIDATTAKFWITGHHMENVAFEGSHRMLIDLWSKSLNEMLEQAESHIETIETELAIAMDIDDKVSLIAALTAARDAAAVMNQTILNRYFPNHY